MEREAEMRDERRIEKGGKGIGKESEEERLGRQREEVSLLFVTLTHAAARSTPGTRPQDDGKIERSHVHSL